MFWYMHDLVHLQQNKNNNQDGIVEHKNSTKAQSPNLHSGVIWADIHLNSITITIQKENKNQFNEVFLHNKVHVER